MKEFPDLKTDRCHLVQTTLDDAEAIFETINTLECQMNMPEFYSAFHHKERITHFIQVFSIIGGWVVVCYGLLKLHQTLLGLWVSWIFQIWRLCSMPHTLHIVIKDI